MTEETTGGQTQWPRSFPYLTALGLMAGLALTAGLIWLKVDRAKPLQKHYIFQYFGTYFYKEFEPQIRKRLPYRVVYMGEFPAENERIERFPDAPLYVATRQFVAAKWNLFLRDFVYDGHGPFEFFRWQLIFGGTATLLLFLALNSADGKRRRRAKEGRILRGHGLITRWKYNMTKSTCDGWSFPVANRKNFMEFLLRENRIRMSFKDTFKHIIGFADTGGGKSTFITELLYQVEEEWLKHQQNPKRKPTGMPRIAVILDPDGEYYRRFFRKSRGDIQIDFKSVNCPSYNPGREAMDEIEAVPLARGLLSEGDRKDWFERHAWSIIAYLIAVFHPNARELEEMVSDEKVLDAKLVGSEHAGTLKDNADGQRQAIIGTLAEIAMGLRMIPDASPEHPDWCVADWLPKRPAWIFFTSTPSTSEAQAPLQTMILNQIIMKTQGYWPDAPPVAVFLDEIAAMERPIPKVKTASTRGRKWSIPLVLFTQGMSQLKRLYGEYETEELVSGPTTNIFLRTRSASASKALSEHIGSPEYETVTESRSENGRSGGGSSSSAHIGQKPLVIPQEIANLPDLDGYFCQPGVTIKIRLIPRPLRELNPPYEERVITMRKKPVALNPAPVAAPVAISAPIVPKPFPAGGRKTWTKIEGQKEQEQLSLLGVITEK